VQRAAFARQQLVVDDLLDERVTERVALLVAARFDDEKVARNRLPERQQYLRHPGHSCSRGPRRDAP
jgi:hypothetical protein